MHGRRISEEVRRAGPELLAQEKRERSPELMIQRVNLARIRAGAKGRIERRDRSLASARDRRQAWRDDGAHAERAVRVEGGLARAVHHSPPVGVPSLAE